MRGFELPDAVRRRGGPFVWATWITALLAGDEHCRYRAWVRANHEFYPRVREDDAGTARLAKWKGEHADMVRARQAELEADGWTVHVEGANKFVVRGATASLAGGPDLVAVRDHDVTGAREFALDGEIEIDAPVSRQALVDDCKTGRRKDADHWQVVIYMTYLPAKHPALADLSRVLSGRVSYADGLPRLVPPGAADSAAAGRIAEMVRMCAAPSPPPRAPSVGECRYCDILGCQDRADVDEAPIDTEEF